MELSPGVHQVRSGPKVGTTMLKLVRRAMLALGVGSIVAAVLRVRGSGGVAPRQGGWRELSGPDLG